MACLEGACERAAQRDPGHSRSSSNLCSTYSSSSSRTLQQNTSSGAEEIRHDVPWEWQVSAKSFVGDVSRECSAAAADKCRQAQCGDSSPRGLAI